MNDHDIAVKFSEMAQLVLSIAETMEELAKRVVLLEGQIELLKVESLDDIDMGTSQ